MNAPAADIRPDDFKFLSELLYQRSGLVLTPDKTYLLDSRLLPIARAHGCQSISGLADLLRTRRPDNVIKEVIEAMTTNESSFFRDGKPFEHLRKDLLPRFKQKLAAQSSIRIWSAACSTGQEPYSMAISLLEESPNMPGWRYEMVATDLAGKVLDKAAHGVYSQFEAQRGMPIQLLIKYFNPQPDSCWQVKDEIKKMVQFRPQNLLESFIPLGKFDLILCRNVLIYFDEPTKNKVIANMTAQLNPGGVLILGSTETIMDKTIAGRFDELSRGVYALK